MPISQIVALNLKLSLGKNWKTDIESGMPRKISFNQVVYLSFCMPRYTVNCNI